LQDEARAHAGPPAHQPPDLLSLHGGSRPAHDLLQFLREKQFIRSLSQPEIDQLKAKVAQVRCSGCGAVVDLARDAACSYCRSPVSVLDAEAVDKTLAALTEATASGRRPARRSSPSRSSRSSRPQGSRARSAWTRPITPMQSSPALLDLVVEGIGYLFTR